MNSKTITKDLHQIAFDIVSESSSSSNNNKSNVEWTSDLNQVNAGSITRSHLPIVEQASKSLHAVQEKFQELESKDQSETSVIKAQLELLDSLHEHQLNITASLSVDADQGQLLTQVSRASQLVNEMKSKVALILVQNL